MDAHNREIATVFELTAIGSKLIIIRIDRETKHISSAVALKAPILCAARPNPDVSSHEGCLGHAINLR